MPPEETKFDVPKICLDEVNLLLAAQLLCKARCQKKIRCEPRCKSIIFMGGLDFQNFNGLAIGDIMTLVTIQDSLLKLTHSCESITAPGASAPNLGWNVRDFFLGTQNIRFRLILSAE